MKSISWLTPTFFIDVDIMIVPELAKSFRIEWIIVGPMKPDIYAKIETFVSAQLSVRFWEIRTKWYMPNNYFDYYKLFKFMVNCEKDLIYIDMAPQLFAFAAAKFVLPKEKTIFATHNVRAPKGARLEKLSRYYMHRLLHTFQNFQVFSKNQYDYLFTLVKDKNVFYAPLALKDYGPKGKRAIAKEIVNFLSFGHIRNYKRIDLLIDAAQQLYEETGKDFLVTIAGSCSNWTKYAKFIHYPHLFDLHIGFVDDREVAGFMGNADYLVLPYQDLAQSGAVTVAFNYGIPVITSDILQFREFVKDGRNGFLFKSEQVDSLKQVMRTALDLSSSEYDILQESTMNYVRENYSLQAITNRYIEFFNCINETIS
jgi:glycosyltransferase involved in cell wall biosynthesis